MAPALPWLSFAVAAALAALGGVGLLAPTHVSPLLLYVGPALFPGLLVAGACLPRARALERWTLGAALSPLVSALLGWAAVRAGLAPAHALRALVIACAAGALALEAALARRAASGRGPAQDTAADATREREGRRARRAVAWLTALGVCAVAVPPLVNRWLLVRSDAWVHGALVWELLLRGFPPQDNWFAGIRLNYVWFFDWYVALLTALRGGEPFVFMGLFNVVNFGLFLGLVYRLARSVDPRPRAAAWSVALALVGLNAGAWILWPIRGLRGLVGEVHGWPAVVAEYQPIPFGTSRILYSLSSPFALMVNLYDKFMVGTALNYAWLLLLVLLVTWLRYIASGARGLLPLAALSALGLLLFHGVVGLSALPVLALAIALACLAAPRLPWLGPPRRQLTFLAATAVGALLGVPYTLSIVRGWAPGVSGLKHSYLAHDPYSAWTLVTATGVVAAIALRPLREAWRAGRAPAVLLAAWTLGTYVFASVVCLPERNESKFAFQAFFGALALAGAGVPAAWQWARAKLGTRWAAVIAALLFLPGPILTLQGFAADPAGRTDYTQNVPPGDAALYRFVRADTPVDAVLVDRDYRDWAMVYGRRRMYCGRPEGPEKFAFPADQVVERHRVIDDLYGPRAHAAQDADALARLGAPIYVIDRPPDPAHPPLPPLDALTPRFLRIYAGDGRVLYRLVPGAEGAAAAAPGPAAGASR